MSAATEHAPAPRPDDQAQLRHAADLFYRALPDDTRTLFDLMAAQQHISTRQMIGRVWAAHVRAYCREEERTISASERAARHDEGLAQLRLARAMAREEARHQRATSALQAQQAAWDAAHADAPGYRTDADGTVHFHADTPIHCKGW